MAETLIITIEYPIVVKDGWSWIPLYENIEDTGEEYHITDMIDDDELIEILQDIENYAI